MLIRVSTPNYFKKSQYYHGTCAKTWYYHYQIHMCHNIYILLQAFKKIPWYIDI